MNVSKSFSGKILILLSILFCLSAIQRVDKLNSNPNRCLTVADGFGYYMYLPHLFQKGSLKMTPEWAQEIQNKHCQEFPVYQLAQRQNGNYIDIYHIGLSYIYLPSYVVGDTVARSSGYERDGFSTPYHVASILNILLFILLGLVYFRKLLLLFVSDNATGYTLLVIYLGTNLLITFTRQYDLPHLYLFALNSIFLYHFFKFSTTKNKWNLIYAVVIFGLASSIRPTQVLIGLVPLIFLAKEYGNTKKFWKSILLFPLLSLLWNIPQIIYWYSVGGELITPNLHTEDIALTDPNLLDFLISYRKGWLLYSPLFLLTPFGLYMLYNRNRKLFWASLSFISLYIYVMCSWETWYYATSFGSRVMVDIYPIIGLVIAILFNSIRNKLWIAGAITFSILCISLNLFQSKQVDLGYLHGERMTEEHYWYIFGQLDIPKYDQSRLLIDKSNLGWIEIQKKFPSANRKVISREIFSLKKPICSIHTKDLTIGRINILELSSTDETMFEVRIKAKTSNKNLSSLLRMEAVSSYNVYGWRDFEVSQKLSETEFTTLIWKYNLPEVRHANDEMQIYLDNDASVSVELEEFTITAHSLIRK